MTPSLCFQFKYLDYPFATHSFLFIQLHQWPGSLLFCKHTDGGGGALLSLMYWKFSDSTSTSSPSSRCPSLHCAQCEGALASGKMSEKSNVPKTKVNDCFLYPALFVFVSFVGDRKVEETFCSQSEAGLARPGMSVRPCPDITSQSTPGPSQHPL